MMESNSLTLSVPHSVCVLTAPQQVSPRARERRAMVDTMGVSIDGIKRWTISLVYYYYYYSSTIAREKSFDGSEMRKSQSLACFYSLCQSVFL